MIDMWFIPSDAPMTCVRCEKPYRAGHICRAEDVCAVTERKRDEEYIARGWLPPDDPDAAA